MPDAHTDAPRMVLMASLDQYDLVRDTLGYSALDLVNDEFDQRIRNLLPVGSWARVESNAVLAIADGDLDRTATAIRDVVRQPFTVRSRSMRLTASVGATTIDGGTNVSDAIRAAASAMRDAARRGGNRWSLYSPATDSDEQTAMRLLPALRSAVQFRQLEVWFQPVVSLADDRPIGLEALARWHHPQLGDIGPGQFIPLAEQNGEIQAVGAFVLGRATDVVKAVRTTRDLALHGVSVSVNVSAAELADTGYAEAMLTRIAAADCHPEWLAVEVTEATISSDDASVRQNLRRLATAGVVVAVDDFGSGASSLERLVECGVGRLKIDRRFVARVATDEGVRRMVTAMIAIADDMGLTIVAEGVETEDQAATLRELGCRSAQGFWFAPAVPATELTSVLADLRASGA